jgi:hypothetical protein
VSLAVLGGGIQMPGFPVAALEVEESAPPAPEVVAPPPVVTERVKPVQPPPLPRKRDRY